MEQEKKEFAGWWLWVLLMVVITIPVLFGMRACGLVGGTFVERKVFENSYQYSEARKTEQLAFRAQLAEIERKLMSDIDSNTRENLEAQAAALRVQLSVSENRQ